MKKVVHCSMHFQIIKILIHCQTILIICQTILIICQTVLIICQTILIILIIMGQRETMFPLKETIA